LKTRNRERKKKGATTDKVMELKVGKLFKLTRKLGSGAFGEIFQGVNIKNNIEVAIKLEPVNTKHP
jgi:serine/threonine protein kinase